jgi:isocitrate dehydrogenase
MPDKPVSTPSPILIENNRVYVPEHPIIPFIEGDGIGQDIWPAARRVLDAAIEHAYSSTRKIAWKQVFAGERAFQEQGDWLPGETLQAFKDFHVGIKGPLTTPIGEGIRSINVALRQSLDLYVCLRPVRYFPGVPSPMRHPEKVNIALFRENVEDVYAGMDFAFDSVKAISFRKWLQDNYPEEFQRIRFPDTSGIGIKPISRDESERMALAAIQYAITHQRRKVTIVHKGNIMKYTEGAFARWAYDMAEKRYGELIYTQQQYRKTSAQSGPTAANSEKAQALTAGLIFVDDVITDAMFDLAISHPEQCDVIVTTNLNGDYLADALASLVGGIGISPGGNINYQTGDAVFEATHGTAPMLAGKNAANPCSLILSGELMLRHLGWNEAADRVNQAVQSAILSGVVTADFHESIPGSTLASTSEFSDQIIRFL